MNFIDTHLHLNAKEFEGDLGEVISRARAVGVRHMITIGSGYGPENYRSAAEIAERYNLLFAAGVHPHDADLGLSITAPDPYYLSRLEKILTNISAISSNPRMVGIGEVGLDYYYNHSDRGIQRETFYRFLEISVALKMPVIIHSRDAFEDTIDIIKAFNGKIRGEFHCFTGDTHQARVLLDMGFYISIAGIVTFSKTEEIRQVVGYLPSDRILIETDSPFLSPTPYRGMRNEPSFIVKTYEKVAELRGTNIEDLSRQVFINTANCLRIKEGYFDDTN